jgi:small subunit ribosomal protein S4
MSQSRARVRRARALGIALTPKAARHLERRPYPPGEHGRKRRRGSDHQVRLLEKQRLREQYGISEKQMRRTFDDAMRRPGKTGENLISLLERRLDASVLRAGLARTVAQARQLVSHGHITVDGERVDRPSYRLRPGETLQVHPRSRDKTPFMLARAGEYAAGPAPSYLRVDRDAMQATLLREPARFEVPVQAGEQLVVEFYAR